MPFIPNSFGDIVTAINLVLSIYSALREIDGAAEDYQDLVDELDTFHGALVFAEKVVSALQIEPESNVGKHIQKEINRCLELLRTFHSFIDGYKKLGQGKGRRWYLSIPDKIRWKLFKKRKISDIRRKVSQHRETILLFLSQLNTSQINDMKNIMGTVSTEIRTVCKNIPPPVGYGIGNSMLLTTALGTEITVPMEHCYMPEDLHKFLLLHFHNKSGHVFVEAHSYTISRNYGVEVTHAEPKNWREIMVRGERVVMSVVVRKNQDYKNTETRKHCPKCGPTDAGIMEDDGWYTCRRCDRRFRSPMETTSKNIIRVKNNDLADFRNIVVQFDLVNLVRELPSGDGLRGKPKWSLLGPPRPRSMPGSKRGK